MKLDPYLPHTVYESECQWTHVIMMFVRVLLVCYIENSVTLMNGCDAHSVMYVEKC